MGHSASMQLVTGLADQIRKVKEHSSAFAKLRDDYYMIVTSNNSVVYITIGGRYCYVTVPLGIDEVTDGESALTVMALANYLRAEKGNAFELSSLSHGKVTPWSPSLPVCLTYSCPLAVLEAGSYTLFEFIEELSYAYHEFSPTFRDASIGVSLTELCQRYDGIYQLSQFVKRVKDGEVRLVPAEPRADSHASEQQPVDLAKLYPETRPAFLEAKDVRVVSESVNTSSFRLVAHGRTFEAEVAHNDSSAQVTVDISCSIDNPQEVALRLAQKCLMDNGWRGVTPTVDPLYGRARLYVYIADLDVGCLDRAITTLTSFLCDNYSELMELIGTSDAGHSYSAGDDAPPDEQFIQDQRTQYRFQRSCLLAGAIRVGVGDVSYFSFHRHPFHLAIHADTQYDSLYMDFRSYASPANSVAREAINGLSRKQAALFLSGRSSWMIHQLDEEAVFSCVYPLGMSLIRKGGYDALFEEVTNTMRGIKPLF